MSTRISDLSIDESRQLVSEAVRDSLEDAIEDLAALRSPDYVQSIKEAREDARQGRLTGLAGLLCNPEGVECE